MSNSNDRSIFHNKEDNSKRETKEIQSDGSFERQKALFSIPFGMEEGQLPVEKERYRLIWSAPCPWSHRAVIVRKLLGLEEAISLGTVDPIRPTVPRIDWAFSLDKNEKDPVLGVKYLSELYTNTEPNYSGRPTVPAVIDLETNKVVHNDYFTLTNELETSWSPFHKDNAPNLYPEQLRKEIDELNDVIYSDINNGVYQCGFAQSQQAYERAYDILFSRLEQIEQRLQTRRFLFGDYVTDADVRLYVTLVRFDVAYYTVFKANKKRIIDFQNLWEYARDLYHIPGFGDTTDFDAIKRHYYISARLSPTDNNDKLIIPKGPDITDWGVLPNRKRLSNDTEVFLRT